MSLVESSLKNQARKTHFIVSNNKLPRHLRSEHVNRRLVDRFESFARYNSFWFRNQLYNWKKDVSYSGLTYPYRLTCWQKWPYCRQRQYHWIGPQSSPQNTSAEHALYQADTCPLSRQHATFSGSPWSLDCSVLAWGVKSNWSSFCFWFSYFFCLHFFSIVCAFKLTARWELTYLQVNAVGGAPLSSPKFANKPTNHRIEVALPESSLLYQPTITPGFIVFGAGQCLKFGIMKWAVELGAWQMRQIMSVIMVRYNSQTWCIDKMLLLDLMTRIFEQRAWRKGSRQKNRTNCVLMSLGN